MAIICSESAIASKTEATMSNNETEYLGIPEFPVNEPSREMDEDECRAAVDILWVSLGLEDVEGVDEQTWKQKKYKVFTGRSYSSTRLTYSAEK
jgi:hypothetical protein